MFGMLGAGPVKRNVLNVKERDGGDTDQLRQNAGRVLTARVLVLFLFLFRGNHG
jgi:hypothetical protein